MDFLHKRHAEHFTYVANDTDVVIYAQVSSIGEKSKVSAMTVIKNNTSAVEKKDEVEFPTHVGRVRVSVYKYRSSGDYEDTKPDTSLEGKSNRNYIVKQISTGDLVVKRAKKGRVWTVKKIKR